MMDEQKVYCDADWEASIEFIGPEGPKHVRATIVDLPDIVYGVGETVIDALNDLNISLSAYMNEYTEDNRPIPKPRKMASV